MNTAIVILAAGASSRLGQPKQLLQFRGRTLLQHAIGTAGAAHCGPVFVVVGAVREIATSATVVENPAWAEGMASSIRAGISALPSAISGAVLMTCDQPLVTAELLKTLCGAGPLAAAEYNHTIGVPAFFSRDYFPELLALQGGEGAKRILLAHETAVARIPFPDAAIDIDTVADAERLRQI